MVQVPRRTKTATRPDGYRILVDEDLERGLEWAVAVKHHQGENAGIHMMNGGHEDENKGTVAAGGGTWSVGARCGRPG